MKVNIPFDATFNLSKQYEDEEGNWIIEGFAATTDLDLQGDMILEEAIKSSEKDLEQNSTVLHNHHPDQEIGKVLQSKVKDNNLFVKILISKTVPLIWKKIQEGILDKFSIKGKILDAAEKFIDSANKVVRLIKQMYLTEVSLVSVPANPKAASIGWYVEKALNDWEKEGGTLMKGFQKAREKFKKENERKTSLEKAQGFIDEKKPDEAEEILKGLLKTNSEDEEAKNLLEEIKKEDGDDDSADDKDKKDDDTADDKKDDDDSADDKKDDDADDSKDDDDAADDSKDDDADDKKDDDDSAKDDKDDDADDSKDDDADDSKDDDASDDDKEDDTDDDDASDDSSGDVEKNLDAALKDAEMTKQNIEAVKNVMALVKELEGTAKKDETKKKFSELNGMLSKMANAVAGGTMQVQVEEVSKSDPKPKKTVKKKDIKKSTTTELTAESIAKLIEDGVQKTLKGLKIVPDKKGRIKKSAIKAKEDLEKDNHEEDTDEELTYAEMEEFMKSEDFEKLPEDKQKQFRSKMFLAYTKGHTKGKS